MTDTPIPAIPPEAAGAEFPPLSTASAAPISPAVRRILDKHRRGEPITPADQVQTIATLAELNAYREGLSAQGLLDTDAYRAIQAWQDYLMRRGDRP
jgi:hypothetical protein